MDVINLKDKLKNNAEDIILILEKIDCGKIKYIKGNNQIRTAIDLDPLSNGNSICINIETLQVTSFSDRFMFQGDLIAFIMSKCNCRFNDAIKLICSVIGVDFKNYNSTPVTKMLPFGGYYKNIKKQSTQEVELPTYTDSILDEYRDIGSELFLNDGISLETQKIFNVRMDYMSERIVFPWRNSVGEIVAIVGRWNGEDYEENNQPKYKPIVPIVGFQKSQLLYGMCENYNNIQNEGVLYVFESEKSIMKAHSMGINTCVAVGSHAITDTQARLIKSLTPSTILICFDEDIKDEEYLKQQCSKLKYNNTFMHSDIGFILDKDNKYLGNGSKKSPIDIDKKTFASLCAECIQWYKEE